MDTKESQKQLVSDCRNCKFRIINKIDQTGCYAQDISYDESEMLRDENGISYHKFKHKICQYKIEENPGDLSTEELYQDVRNKVKIPYILTVFGSTDCKLLSKTLKSLKDNLKPRRVVIPMPPGTNINETQKCVEDIQLGCKWTITEPLIDQDIRVFVMDQFISQGHFFCYVNAGFKFKIQIFDWLDKQINDHGFRFQLIGANKEGNGLILPKPVYYGNMVPIKDLISEIKRRNIDYYEYDSISEHALRGNDWSRKCRKFKWI